MQNICNLIGQNSLHISYILRKRTIKKLSQVASSSYWQMFSLFLIFCYYSTRPKVAKYWRFGKYFVHCARCRAITTTYTNHSLELPSNSIKRFLLELLKYRKHETLVQYWLERDLGEVSKNVFVQF